ncbi:MAG: hypothetical protein M1817_001270 [Caeruleum heppii]|nr:MAG: hypothetical protein M1817_001270 [Caeruleum heppii]
METSRNEIFQKLKPCCVKLSQTALTYGRATAGSKDLISSLESLLKLLEDLARPDGAFDIKLTEYVFFPLSHVFRQSQKVPERALELAVLCLIRLLVSGWRTNLPLNVGRQLLILLTFIAGGNPADAEPKSVSEELHSVAFTALSTLFESLKASHSSNACTSAEDLPPLGHAAVVLLDGIETGESNEVRLAALSALASFQAAVSDREALANFFPRTISSLTKTLQPRSSQHKSWRLTMRCLSTLSNALRSVLSDEYFSQDTGAQETDNKKPLSASWLKATASQVKLALANVMPIRDSDKAEVRRALLELCLVVLEDCSKSLSESVPMIVETMIIVSSRDELDREPHAGQALLHMATARPSILEAVKGSLHTWMLGLPRIMQSNDDQKKQRIGRQISACLRLLSQLGAGSGFVEDLMSTNLRDAVVAMLRGEVNKAEDVQDADEESTALELVSARPANSLQLSFPSILMGQDNQRSAVGDVQLLLRQLKSSRTSASVAKDMIASLPLSSGHDLLASFWLALNIVQNSIGEDSLMDQYINIESHTHARLLDELYAYSVDTIRDPWGASHQDWRIQSLSLEIIALQAQQQGEDFRPELVDALYPVLHLLGSSNSQLRRHAIICLDILARATGYPSTRDLIIGNVDYLVNAVALKLNIFDISPQAPQVLLMIIKLTGPTLLPYLDDLIGSIFAALDNFHGYPRLVELLFSVLTAVVEEGSKGDALSITAGKEIDHRKTPWRDRTMEEVTATLRRRREKAMEELTPSSPRSTTPPFPRRPWKEYVSPADAEGDADTSPSSPPSDDLTTTSAPTQTPTYTLLHRIALLTQHYLPSSSPTLRLSLLTLLRTATPTLATNEDVFLPLINSLWPVVAKRLYDEEVYVVVAATETIAALCVGAGDFLSSRVADEWDRTWRVVNKVWNRLRIREEGRRGPSGSGPSRQTLAMTAAPATGNAHLSITADHRLLAAFLGLFTTLTRYTRLDDEILDQLVEMGVSIVLMYARRREEKTKREKMMSLGQGITSSAKGSGGPPAPLEKMARELLSAVEGINPDAVWVEMEFQRWEGGQSEADRREVPTLEGFTFRPVDFGGAQ